MKSARRKIRTWMASGTLLAGLISCHPTNLTASTLESSSSMNTPKQSELLEELLPKAEAGDAQAQFQLGNLYDAPDDTSSPESCRQALFWYEQAAAQGHPKAAEHAGYVILNGLAGDTDHARAMKWLSPAAEAGSAWASLLIATSYHRGQGVPASPEKALSWFERAAELGAGEAMFRLGYACANGQNTPRDEAKAIEWFRKGAEKENSASLACLGAMAWGGKGMERDYALAKNWFEQAMAVPNGNTWAPYMLGIMAENGQGMPRDMKQAEAYYKQSAEGGYYGAKIRCALLHAAGSSVPDYQEDLKWLIQGAENGAPMGQFILGLAYLQGTGVEESKAEALVWLGLASEFGMTAASEICEGLRKQLPDDAVRKADDRMDELREKFERKGVVLF